MKSELICIQKKFLIAPYYYVVSLPVFPQDMTLVGKNIQKLTKSYNDAVSKGYNRQGSLLRQCQVLKELGVNYKHDEKQDEVELIDDSFVNLPNDVIVSSAESESPNGELM